MFITKLLLNKFLKWIKKCCLILKIQIRAVVKNILKIFTGTFISRIFGFIREMVVAFFFGTGKIADAFTLALIFPNLFRQVLGEDMVERAFMPPFKTIFDKGEKEKAWRFLSVVFNWFFFALLAVTFLLYLIVPLFFSLKDSYPHIFGFLFKDQGFDYDLTLDLILILLPFTIFIGIAAFLGSLLNFFEKNWIFGLAPAMLSIGVILGLVLFYSSLGGYSIAVGYVMGAFLQMAIQLPFVFNKKFKRENNLKLRLFKTKDKSQDFKTIKRESRFITFNALLDKTQEIFGRFFAATLVTGATSSIFYAARLYQLPFAILSLPIARGINPQLNKLKAKNQKAEFNTVFNRGLWIYILMFFPVTVWLVVSAPELVNLIFKRGQFDSTALDLTSKAFVMYAFGLLPMSLVGYFKRVLSLFDLNKFTLYISMISAVANIVFALLFVKITPLQHEGIALASSLAFSINMFVMFYYLKKSIPDFVTLKNSFVELFLFGIISGAIILIVMTSDWYFLSSKSLSLLSIAGKFVGTFSIFIGIYFFNKKIRLILTSFFRK
jgi:putative peptidoglycan lipid II flippase